MKQFNLILGTVSMLVSGGAVLTIACGPHIGQGFALLSSVLAVATAAKLAVDQL